MLHQTTLIITMVVTGSLGIIVSAIAALVGGAGFPSVVIRPFISGLVMALLGGGAYFIVKWKVPEITDSADSDLKDHPSEEINDAGVPENMQGDDGKVDTNIEVDAASTDKNLADKPANKYAGSSSGVYVPQASKNRKVTGDQIEVEGVALPKQPELMAKAVQHVLDTDKDSIEGGPGLTGQLPE